MLIQGNAFEVLRSLDSESVDCCVTSPPYWNLRNYGHDPREIGQEDFRADYISAIGHVCVQIFRVLKKNGNFWLNLGDTYAQQNEGLLKKGSLSCSPWLIAINLCNYGWILREDIVWEKPNAMPESVNNRCTRSHEYLFHFVKSMDYTHAYEHIREKSLNLGETSIKFGGNKHSEAHGGTYSGNKYTDDGFRNKRSVWRISASKTRHSHIAPFPEELVSTCLMASFKEFQGVVLDPFVGSGTTGIVAKRMNLEFIGIDLDITIAKERLGNV